jgi:hypothetical protein
MTARLKILAGVCGVCFIPAPGHSADMPVKAQPAPPAAASLDERWSATFASEVRYFSWKGDRGSPSGVNGSLGSGSQLYIPYALQFVGQPNDTYKVELLGRGGWVRAKQSTPGLTGEIDTITDTVANGTFTYLGHNGVQPFASLSVNMPTGTSALFGSAANARMDPDLVELSSYGEGWNVGPTIGFNLPLAPDLIFTMSAGYTWRGAFARENSLTPENSTLSPSSAQVATTIDPGDVVTGTASLASKYGAWSSSLVLSVSAESKTEEGGAALYRPGLRYLGTATVNYDWTENRGVTTLSASAAHASRNEVLFTGASALATEPLNTNSNLYRVGLQHLMPFGQLWAGPTGSYLYRDANGYDSLTLQFVPAKARYAAGMVARYAASDKVSFNAKIDHVWTRENETDAINGQQFSVLANAFVLGSAVPVVSSTGWQFAGGLNVKF